MSLSLRIKTTSGKTYEMPADPDLTIFDLKAMLCEDLDTPPESQTVLYKGTVCDDDKTLEELKICDKAILIVLIASKRKQSIIRPREEKTEDTDTNTLHANNANGVRNTALNGNGNATASATANPLQNPLQAQAQVPPQAQALMQNPDFMRQMMANPLMQQMLSNPDMIQNIFSSSPAMQRLLDKNPELRHAMKDPAFMKQMMRAATDPNYRNEMMQNQDRMLRNIESMPGGFNALSRMYNQVQNPMQSALDDMYQQQFGKTTTKISEVDKAQGPTCQPLENPWAPQAQAQPQMQPQQQFPSSFMGAGAANNNSNGNGAGQQMRMVDMVSVMQMMNGMNVNNASHANMPMHSNNPRESYALQLQELHGMGFYDEQRNIRALVATGGNIDAAIEYLVNDSTYTSAPNDPK